MKAIVIALVAASALLAAGVSPAADSPLRASKDETGGLFIAATLAPLNSFEFKAAPAYTRLASLRRSASVALRKGSITVERAESVQAKADNVRAQLDKAVDVCKQDRKSGACTGDSRQAERLLASAQRALQAIR